MTVDKWGKPVTEKEVLTFLLNLRDSGAINMFGAIPYIMEGFDISREEAGKFFKEFAKNPTKYAEVNKI